MVFEIFLWVYSLEMILSVHLCVCTRWSSARPDGRKITSARAREIFFEQAMDGGDWVKADAIGGLLCLMPALSFTDSEGAPMPLKDMKVVMPCDVQIHTVFWRRR